MQLLKERILKDGIVKPGNILKVDSFLNHQMDITLINEIGKEFKRRFADCPITKILTIEASGTFKGCTGFFDDIDQTEQCTSVCKEIINQKYMIFRSKEFLG